MREKQAREGTETSASSGSTSLSTDDPGGGSDLLPPSVGSTSDTMDNKDNLGGASTNDDPRFRGNSSTSKMGKSNTKKNDKKTAIAPVGLSQKTGNCPNCLKPETELCPTSS